MNSITHRITSVKELEPYQHMASRAHVQGFKAYINDKRAVIVGASVDGQPVGLTLVVIESQHSAAVKSVYVDKDFRRQGLASQMIQFAEGICSDDGAETIFLPVRLPSQSQPIRQVVRGLGWSSEPKRLRYLNAMCSKEMTLDKARWRKRQLSDPRLEVFPWHELTQDDLDDLKRAYESDDCWFDKKLSPLVDNTNLYKPMSIGLRFDGNVIGWSVTHRFKKGPVIFSVMFARPIPEYPMAGLKLMQETADRLIEMSKGPPVPLLCAIVDGNKFFHFFERKVFRYLPTDVKEMDVYSKELHKPQCVAVLPSEQF